MAMSQPYFMTNKEWFIEEYNEDHFFTTFTLTDKAPQEAIDSYNEFIEMMSDGKDR